eukprot:m.33308 g.33308  ORF g.33308 m.33308 type:complete len:610 (+) comp8513_c0_seq3:531-2360(+)
MCSWNTYLQKCKFNFEFCSIAGKPKCQYAPPFDKFCQWDDTISVCLFNYNSCNQEGMNRNICNRLHPYEWFCEWDTANDVCRPSKPQECPSNESSSTLACPICRSSPWLSMDSFHPYNNVDSTLRVAASHFVHNDQHYAFESNLERIIADLNQSNTTRRAKRQFSDFVFTLSGGSDDEEKEQNGFNGESASDSPRTVETKIMNPHQTIQHLKLVYTGINCMPEFDSYCNLQQDGWAHKKMTTTLGNPQGTPKVTIIMYGDGTRIATFKHIKQCESFGEKVDLRWYNQLEIVIGTDQDKVLSIVSLHLSCFVGISTNDEFGSIRVVGYELFDGTTEAVCTAHIPASETSTPAQNTAWILPYECSVCNYGAEKTLVSVTLEYQGTLEGGDLNLQGDRTAYDIYGALAPTIFVHTASDLAPISVPVGGVVQISSENGLPSNLSLEIQGVGSVFFDTSCTRPLRLGDRYGPFLLVGFANENQESIDDIATYCTSFNRILAETLVDDGSGNKKSAMASPLVVGVGVLLVCSVLLIVVALIKYRSTKHNYNDITGLQMQDFVVPPSEFGSNHLSTFSISGASSDEYLDDIDGNVDYETFQKEMDVSGKDKDIQKN